MGVSKPIIAAVDPRREDVAPAALGAMLAQVLDARLVLAAVYAVDLSIDNLYPEYARTLGRDADRAVDRVAALIGDTGIPVSTTAIADGSSPARALRALAEREDAQLLVIGSSERGPVGRVSSGAVTDRLLHHAPCPVAIAPAGFAPTGLRLIGVGYTDRPDGHAALDFAQRLAASADARVRILSVAEPSPARLDGALEPLAQDYLRLAHDEAARMALEQGIAALPADRSAGGRLLTGSAADALSHASRDLDLLVCGTRGHGPMRTAVLGGTSHSLVRRAHCPVIVVPGGRPAELESAKEAMAP